MLDDAEIKRIFKSELKKFNFDADWFEKSHDLSQLREDQLDELRIYDAAMMAMRLIAART